MNDERCVFDYHNQLAGIATKDLEYIRRKDTQYQASWKRRGGPGAFFTFARPWDRLESIAAKAGYDVFGVIDREGLEGPDGSLIACVRDMRRYLLLLEAEMTQRFKGGDAPQAVPATDSNKHAERSSK